MGKLPRRIPKQEIDSNGFDTVYLSDLYANGKSILSIENDFELLEFELSKEKAEVLISVLRDKFSITN